MIVIHSPCIGVCTLVDDVCVGCYRTKQQIGDWLHYTNEERERMTEECKSKMCQTQSNHYPTSTNN